MIGLIVARSVTASAPTNASAGDTATFFSSFWRWSDFGLEKWRSGAL
jgi:hypothetical protein